MPVRKGPARIESREVDPLSCFHWSDTGLESPIGEGYYQTEAEARRAWEKHRRAVWARCHRFQLPGPAKVYDGLTLEGLAFVRWNWGNVPPFDVSAALDALAVDRANLAAFRNRRGAKSIRDYLDLFASDLDLIEHTARDLGRYPAGEWRPYPGHLNVSTKYGSDAQAPLPSEHDDPEDMA